MKSKNYKIEGDFLVIKAASECPDCVEERFGETEAEKIYNGYAAFPICKIHMKKIMRKNELN